VPLRHGDIVQFVGPGPWPTRESESRHDPEGDPRPGDYGHVVEVKGDVVRVAWRFGATTDCSIDHLAKQSRRSQAHRYRVVFEQLLQREDVTYTIVTEGGEPKAVWMASAALARDHPDYRPFTVEIEDLGTNFQPDSVNDLVAWDEIS
jgi:hypothetical protein